MKFKLCIFDRDLYFKNIPNQYLDGFYDAESWGRWSCGRQSKISLQIPYTDNDLQIAFKLHVFALEKISNQRIDVFVNNRKITSWDFANKKALPDTKLLISHKFLNKTGVLNIRFVYSKTYSPKKLNIGVDNRHLAVGFESMKIIKICKI